MHSACQILVVPISHTQLNEQLALHSLSQEKKVFPKTNYMRSFSLGINLGPSALPHSISLHQQFMFNVNSRLDGSLCCSQSVTLYGATSL